MTIRSTRLYVLIVMAILAVAVFIRSVDPFFVRALRLIGFDMYQILAPQPYDPALPVRIVDIDEASLAKVAQWPWPRTRLRDLVNVLAEKGAAVIAFDMVFPERDRTSLEEIVKTLPPEQASLVSGAIGEKHQTNDEAFAEALKETASVLATMLTHGEKSTLPEKAGFAIAGDDPLPFIPDFASSSRNLAVLDEAAKGIGAINFVPDRDLVVRRAELVFRIGDRLVPSLPAEALRVAQGATTYLLKSANASGEKAFGRNTGLNHLKIGGIEIATGANGAIALKFRHSNPEAFIPAWRLLSGEVTADEISGRIILVGTSAPGLLDLRATPLDPAIPGVEIVAQILEHILAGRTLARPDYALGLEQLLLVVPGLALAFWLPRVSARSSAAISLAVIGALLLGGWISFRYLGLLLDPLYPALVLGILSSAITVHIYRQVERQRSEIRNAFDHYLSPSVVEAIIRKPEMLKLGGEVRELTLLFCDVRDFTARSERLTAVEVTQFMNELLTPMSEIIVRNHGTIDKYMGDGIMAFWNAPLDDPDHADHACRAALEMLATLDLLNKRWEERARAASRSFSLVKLGIGVNTGFCCVGNLGSIDRFDYSAIGDDVNVTCRLENLSKFYGVTMVVSRATLANLPGWPALELDLVQVRGRSSATAIFTPMDTLYAAPGQLVQLPPLHSRFLAAYRARRWDDAKALIARCRLIGVQQLDIYYAMFAERIDAIRGESLPENWDGVHIVTEK